MSQVSLNASEVISDVESLVTFLESVENPSIQVRSAVIEGTKFLARLRTIDPIEFNASVEVVGDPLPIEDNELIQGVVLGTRPQVELSQRPDVQQMQVNDPEEVIALTKESFKQEEE